MVTFTVESDFPPIFDCSDKYEVTPCLGIIMSMCAGTFLIFYMKKKKKTIVITFVIVGRCLLEDQNNIIKYFIIIILNYYNIIKS